MLRDDPVAIVGVAVPRVAKHIPDETATSLTLKSVLAAIDDAGLGPQDVTGMAATWPGPGGSPQAWSSNWARQLGLRLNWVIDEGLDVGGIRAVLNGAAAIKAGLCETVVVATATAGGPAQSGRDRMRRSTTADRSSFRERQAATGTATSPTRPSSSIIRTAAPGRSIGSP